MSSSLPLPSTYRAETPSTSASAVAARAAACRRYPMASEVLLTSGEVRRAVHRVAAAMAADYAPCGLTHERPLLLLVVLKGSYIFAADLARALGRRGVPTRVDFVRCKSYEAATTESNAKVRLLLDVGGGSHNNNNTNDNNTNNNATSSNSDNASSNGASSDNNNNSSAKGPLAGRHVLIVEDIIDTANTIVFLHKTFAMRGAASVRTVTLLDKPSRRAAAQTHVTADYTLFEIPNKFVIGYGLDYDEKYRELPDVGVLHPRHYVKDYKEEEGEAEGKGKGAKAASKL